MKLERLNGISVVEGDSPLTEFRLFRAGVNETAKGPCLFDAIAAQSVMQAYTRSGVDIMFDLEHLSLDQKKLNYNPDAMGWARLELRSGELWAVNVRWNPAGLSRLQQKTQRYCSPAFAFDPADKNRRVLEVVNVALTSMPATYETQALIAASRLEQLSTEKIMDPKIYQDALDALISGDGEACATILRALIVQAATGEATEEATELEQPVVDPLATASAVAPATLSNDASNLVVATLLSTTGASDVTEALSIVDKWGKAQIEVLSQRHGLELASRRMLIAQLVTLGVETPATAWEGEPDLRIPVARLSSEPIEAMRARIKTLSASGVRRTNLERPTVTSTLTSQEVEYCALNKVSHAEFLARKAALYKRANVNSAPIAGAGVTAQ